MDQIKFGSQNLENIKKNQRILVFGDVHSGLHQEDAEIQYHYLKELLNNNAQKLNNIHILHEGRSLEGLAEMDQFFNLLNKSIQTEGDLLLIFDNLEKCTPISMSNINIRTNPNYFELIRFMFAFIILNKQGLLKIQDIKTANVFTFFQSLDLTLQKIFNDNKILFTRMKQLEEKIPNILQQKLQTLIASLKDLYQQQYNATADIMNLSTEMDIPLGINPLTDHLFQVLQAIINISFSFPQEIIEMNDQLSYKKAIQEIAQEFEKNYEVITNEVIKSVADKYGLSLKLFQKIVHDFFIYKLKTMLFNVVTNILFNVDGLELEAQTQDFECLYEIFKSPQPTIAVFVGYAHIENLISLLQELGYDETFKSSVMNTDNKIIFFEEVKQMIMQNLEAQQGIMQGLMATNKPLSADEMFSKSPYYLQLKPIDLKNFDLIIADK